LNTSNRNLIAVTVLLWVLHVVLRVVQRLASPEVHSHLRGWPRVGR
jgi:hypothetical protein